MVAPRRPLVNVSGTITENSLTDYLIEGMISNLSRTVFTGTVTAVTASTRYHFLNGTSGAGLAVTLPAASASIDGLLLTFSSTTNRAAVTWSSSGATVTGLPNSLVANQSITIQYIHSQTRWFVS